MDMDTLRRYRSSKAAVEAIQEELEELYNPVKSLSFYHFYESSKDMTGSTVRTLRKVERQEERLREALEKYVDLAEEIETWIADLDDPMIETIVRQRIILGKSWANTFKAAFGYPGNVSTARMMLTRYLDKETEKRNTDKVCGDEDT